MSIRCVPLSPPDEWLSALKPLRSSARNGAAAVDPGHSWRTMLDHFPYPVALFDRRLRHVYVNPATELATSIPVQEFLGKSMRELGHPDDIAAQIETNLSWVFASGEERTFSLIFDGPAGTVIYQCHMTPHFSVPGEAEHVMVVSRDSSRWAALQ